MTNFVQKCFILAGLLSFALCSATSVAVSEEQSGQRRVVIFRNFDAEGKTRGRPDGQKYWLIDEMTAKQAAEAAARYVAESGPLTGDAPEAKPDNYVYQIFGYFKGSQKRIGIRGVCRQEWRPGWDDHVVSVYDGGYCFFDSDFNSKTGEVEDFVFHGFG